MDEPNLGGDTIELPVATAKPVGQRFVERLPPWAGSVRTRLTLLYSVLLFGLAAIVVGGIYLGLSRELDNQSVYRSEEVVGIFDTPQGRVIIEGDVEVLDELALFEKAVNQQALQKLRNYSFGALALLFVSSLAIGWYVANLVLRPIGRIAGVAQEIQATDLKRRIRMRGPNDELRFLADTFDDMLGRLDQAFEGQRRFIHEASHELRNPLAVIRTNIDVVQSDPHATIDDYREVGEVVGRTAERMTTLVDDLLLYARQESPDQREELLDVSDVVADTATEYRAAAEADGINLIDQAPRGLLVHGDAVALRRALANLVANAIRYSAPGDRIRVAAGIEGAWVWMAVEDQGPGIATGDQKRVWQRFWRGEQRRGRPLQARSGLGLTIVRQIVESHGGQVHLASEVGVGSTFSMWLPTATTSMSPGERPPSTGEILLDPNGARVEAAEAR